MLDDPNYKTGFIIGVALFCTLLLFAAGLCLAPIRPLLGGIAFGFGSMVSVFAALGLLGWFAWWMGWL